MELKFKKHTDNGEGKICSNCTFMELKFPWTELAPCRLLCSNCTFMELKLMQE